MKNNVKANGSEVYIDMLNLVFNYILLYITYNNLVEKMTLKNVLKNSRS